MKGVILLTGYFGIRGVAQQGEHLRRGLRRLSRVCDVYMQNCGEGEWMGISFHLGRK